MNGRDPGAGRRVAAPPDRGAARGRPSPRLRPPGLSGAVPGPHTEAELGALIGLLTRSLSRAGAGTGAIAVGHGRDAPSRAAADAFVTAWQARGGDVLTRTDWPEEAASWLRPAGRLTAQSPDAWVLAGAPLGIAQLVRRLAHSTAWDPARTFGFASLDLPGLLELAGADAVDGLRCVRGDGTAWIARRDGIIALPGPHTTSPHPG
ncbi:hypothetical protein OG413_36035 [Streptomyces sp. NBC_01433]|uniref:hypothetical protein n=1 Tax=Streptomyces sp. NBC_01433 TaxID=2903864 RepID=UPI00224E2470|nr:hypothetical protein [Streptomyces sp. NBC_01433]MCX4680625.1 hypothetical protein [Streptomyces sp. NBC_01433]